MEVKIKAREMVSLHGALMALMATEMPTKLSLYVAFNSNEVDPKWRRFEEQRLKLARSFAETDKSGRAIVKQDGTFDVGAKQEAFAVAFRDLQDMEIDLHVQMIDFGVLPSEMAPGVIKGLLPILKNISFDDAASAASPTPSEKDARRKKANGVGARNP